MRVTKSGDGYWRQYTVVVCGVLFHLATSFSSFCFLQLNKLCQSAENCIKMKEVFEASRSASRKKVNPFFHHLLLEIFVFDESLFVTRSHHESDSFTIQTCVILEVVKHGKRLEKLNATSFFLLRLNNLDLCIQWWDLTAIIRRRTGQLHHLFPTLLSHPF